VLSGESVWSRATGEQACAVATSRLQYKGIRDKLAALNERFRLRG
jgi:hypothetical protein